MSLESAEIVLEALETSLKDIHPIVAWPIVANGRIVEIDIDWNQTLVDIKKLHHVIDDALPHAQALVEQIARLTAPVTDEEAVSLGKDIYDYIDRTMRFGWRADYKAGEEIEIHSDINLEKLAKHIIEAFIAQRGKS